MLTFKDQFGHRRQGAPSTELEESEVVTVSSNGKSLSWRVLYDVQFQSFSGFDEQAYERLKAETINWVYGWNDVYSSTLKGHLFDYHNFAPFPNMTAEGSARYHWMSGALVPK